MAVQSDKLRVLVTCPPMLGLIDEFRPRFEERHIELVTPHVVQTLSEAALKEMLPHADGWIIGDDPASEQVLRAGREGRLRAAVKWGVGVDNVDFEAAKKLGIQVAHTPHMFGAEVADIAVHYLIGLARQTFFIDRQVRAGAWPKPVGISLQGKTVALIGFGDIGRHTARRLYAHQMRVLVYDPYVCPTASELSRYRFAVWPKRLDRADFVVVTCTLTPQTRHLLDTEAFARMKDGVRLVNVSRGPIIDEQALVAALQSGKVHSAALDVFEKEPLPADSPLRQCAQCVFGTHNASNTAEAVRRTTERAIELLFDFLDVK